MEIFSLETTIWIKNVCQLLNQFTELKTSTPKIIKSQNFGLDHYFHSLDELVSIVMLNLYTFRFLYYSKPR